MSQEGSGEVLPASDAPEVKPVAAPVEPQAEESTPSETPEEAKAEPEKEEVKQPPKWATKRINELTRDKYRERAEKEQLARRVQELEALQQQSYQPDPGQLANTQTPQQVNPAQIRKEIEAKVAFDMKCNDAFAKGSSEYADFEDTLGNLRMVGVDEDALGVIVDSDAPHKILQYLGKNPDEAAQLLTLSPVQLAKAVGRLEVKLSAAKPTPKPSAAPDPIKPVGSRGTDTSKPSDKDDLQTWLKKRNAQLGR